MCLPEFLLTDHNTDGRFITSGLESFNQLIHDFVCELLEPPGAQSRHFGETYKWLLYGDDDTYFMSHALLHTLQGLDASMPYFLTGEPNEHIVLWKCMTGNQHQLGVLNQLGNSTSGISLHAPYCKATGSARTVHVFNVKLEKLITPVVFATYNAHTYWTCM